MVSAPKTIDDVIARLSVIVRDTIAAGDRIGYFAALYKRMTIAVREAIRAGEFEDAQRLERLDVTFASRYLLTLEQYRAGELMTRAWLQAYEATRSDKHIILQHLLIGINPHINIDLGVAAARTCPRASLAGLRNDFDKINAVIARLTPVVDEEIDEVSPVSYKIDQIVGPRLKHKFFDFSFEKARDTAWALATELAPLDLARQNTLIDKRDTEAKLLGTLLLTDGPLVRLIRRRESHDVSHNIEILDQSGLPPG